MPKIKAYKGNGVVIPLEEAYIGNAYRCPWTDAIFSTETKYRKHLAFWRETRIRAKIRQDNVSKYLAELNNQLSFDDVIDWISHNPDFMFELYKNNIWSHDADKVDDYRENFSFEITYLTLNWSDHVSNSHSCPRGGVENFTGRYTFEDGTPKPTGYPGWHGRIEYAISHNLGYSTRMTEVFGMHTGTGGGRGKRCGFEVKLFAADWPVIAKAVEKEKEAHNSARVMNALADRHHSPFAWRYDYGEPNYFKR